MLERIIKGVRTFEREVHPELADDFTALAAGQKPLALFITCSDSRIDPNMLTQTKPGELFVIRNAGNIVPPFGLSAGGELATIEYAVAALQVPHIIVCGHSHCGAMQAALNPDSARALPLVREWIKLADAPSRIAKQWASMQSPEELLWTTVQRNVLAQLDHLRTVPAVALALENQAVELHGWVYRFETGTVLAFDERVRRFVPLKDVAIKDPHPTQRTEIKRAV